MLYRLEGKTRCPSVTFGEVLVGSESAGYQQPKRSSTQDQATYRVQAVFV